MITKKILQIFNFFIMFSFLSISSIFAHEGAKGVVKERMDKFKMSKSMMQQINTNIRDKDFKNIEKASQNLLTWSKEMSNYFPEGSDIPPSEASKNIWLDPDGFSKAIQNFEQASLKLVNQSQLKNLDGTIESFKNLANTCKSCHQKFRN